jgi:HK97 family phage prohead protease
MKDIKGNKERRYLQVQELRVKTEDEKMVLTGYAAVFDSLSENLGGFREKIQPGAFKSAIVKSDVRALFNHDSNHVLGRTKSKTLRLKEDNFGLLMECDLPDTQFARDLMTSINRGDITQQSFGFTVKTDQWEEDRDKGEVTRTLVEIDELFDVSPVTYPAYPDTTVAKRSLDNFKKPSEIRGDTSAIARKLADDEKREKYLKSRGLLT